MDGFILPVAVILVFVSFLGLIFGLTKLYVRVPPSQAAVFYGRGSKSADGMITGAVYVSGGGRIRRPFVELVEYMDLNIMSLELDVKDIPNIDGVPVDVKAVANVKIKSDSAALGAAAERFLGLQRAQVEAIIKENLLGNLRAVIGRMSIEDLIKDRDKLNAIMVEEAGSDLVKIGVQLDLLKIQDIKDKNGYIEALGKPKTATVMRDAKVAEAQQTSDADQKAAVAKKDAAVVQAKADADAAQARRDRDVRVAEFNANVNAQNAKAEQAGPLATAEARREVVTRETELAELEAQRREAQLKAEIVKPAEAERQRIQIDAEAAKRKVVLAAEAESEAAKLRGQGEAERVRLVGVAEGEAIKAKLLAEAEGILKKAEALAQLKESGQLYLVAELLSARLPAILEKVSPIFDAIAKPLGSIDSVSIVDIGGSGNGPAKFAGNSVALLVAIKEALGGAGINLASLKQAFLGKGEQKDGALALPDATPSVPATPAPAATPRAPRRESGE